VDASPLGATTAATATRSPKAMIYVDDDGIYWLPDPDAATNQLDGGVPSKPVRSAA